MNCFKNSRKISSKLMFDICMAPECVLTQYSKLEPTHLFPIVAQNIWVLFVSEICLSLCELHFKSRVLISASEKLLLTMLILHGYTHKPHCSVMIVGNITTPIFFSFFSIIKLLHKFLMGLSVIISCSFSSESLSQNRLQ